MTVTLSERPRRASPSPLRIVTYWSERDEPFMVDPDRPACFGCGHQAPLWRLLQRAHLIDRWAGGLDGPQNLVLLCPACHKAMPPFEPGQEDAAVAYVLDGGWYAAAAARRDQVRMMVERTCQQQGIPLTVPAEVARTVAAMVAVRPPRPSKDGAGDARAPAE